MALANEICFLVNLVSKLERSDSEHSGKQFRNDTSAEIGEAVVASVVTESELFVINAEQVEHRRMQIIHVDPVFDGLVAELIGRAVMHAALHAAAGHPESEAVRIVIASDAAL